MVSDLDQRALHEAPGSDVALKIRTGKLTSEALVGACLARIEAREGKVGAWEYLDSDRVIEQARAADRRSACGPLHGVPIGIKDIIDTVDMPTALGSEIYAGRRPQWDAACVAAARRAGAVVLGKTVTDEFAYAQAGKTRNPHQLAHTPGGSSSGSAAAVADFMVPIALGTQTGASVIRPASFCGVFGYKASFGELSLSGIRPLAQSLDTLGIFARSIADIALMRNVLIGASDPTAIAPMPARLRIGVCRTAQWAVAESCTRAAVETSAHAFRHAGAIVRDVDLPEDWEALIDAQKTITAYEAARNYVYETTQFAHLLSEPFRVLNEVGWRTSRETYVNAKQAVASATEQFGEIVSGFDVLVTPATIGEAPLAITGTGDPVMSRMWTALHVPSLAIPVAKGPRGLPVGIQLISSHGEDELLLRIGEWLCEVLKDCRTRERVGTRRDAHA